MILVSGVTGNVGGATARALAARGIPYRAMTRDASRVIAPGDGEVVVADYGDRRSLVRAYAGCERVLAVTSASEQLRANIENAVAAAREAGVEHVVLLTGMGTQVGSPIPLSDWGARNAVTLKESGLRWTILKPNYFMQNTLGSADSIRQGALYGATGDGAISVVHADDIGRVAAAALTGDGHAGMEYDITGPEALTHAEQAAILSEELGHDVAYVDLAPADFRAALVGAGLPDWLADSYTGFHEAFAAGFGSAVTDVVERVGGTNPRTYREFVREHRDGLGGA